MIKTICAFMLAALLAGCGSKDEWVEIGPTVVLHKSETQQAFWLTVAARETQLTVSALTWAKVAVGETHTFHYKRTVRDDGYVYNVDRNWTLNDPPMIGEAGHIYTRDEIEAIANLQRRVIEAVARAFLPQVPGPSAPMTVKPYPEVEAPK